jgi:DNA-binding transcriptional regulator YdaS (Cro superfamily)
MKLSDWLDKQPRGTRAQLARSLGITPTWMCQLTAGRGKASVELAIEIERLTDGQVTRSDMRPDIFGE